MTIIDQNAKARKRRENFIFHTHPDKHLSLIKIYNDTRFVNSLIQKLRTGSKGLKIYEVESADSES